MCLVLVMFLFGRTPGLIAWRDKAWPDDLWAVRRSDDEVAISRVGDDFEVVAFLGH